MCPLSPFWRKKVLALARRNIVGRGGRPRRNVTALRRAAVAFRTRYRGRRAKHYYDKIIVKRPTRSTSTRWHITGPNHKLFWPGGRW